MNDKPIRRMSRRPSFILVTEEEEEEINCCSVIGNMGIPLLYAIAGISTVVGIICMSIITKYWAGLSPPQCFLYSQTASTDIFFQFGTKISSCYWVAYGAIPAVIICVFCAMLYIFHVKDDKEVTRATYVCVLLMFIATILMLAVACTYAQGMRITCASISMNPMNNRGSNCKDKIDSRVSQFNPSMSTAAMISISMATIWLGTVCFMFITIFHIALLIRRRSVLPDY